MKKESVLLVRIDIKRPDGWHTATSEDLPNFFLADPSKNELIDDLPEAIRVLINAMYNANCKVIPSRYGFGKQQSKTYLPWLVVPAEIENVSLHATA